jgi:4'-phosphopantetheinyl transferase
MPPLADGRVEIWRADLDTWECDAEILSPDERARAARFRFERDRGRWMKGRTLLRLLLGRYLQADPREIPIELDANGKPAVPRSSISFNLSHSADLALYAFAWGCAVGIDVELLGRRAEVLLLAERALGLGDAERLGGVPAEGREREFLRSWVRHEAALKCRGGRLGDAVCREGLSLVEVDLGRHAVGTVAVQGAVGEVRLLECDRPGRERPGRPSPYSAAQLAGASGAAGQRAQ